MSSIVGIVNGSSAERTARTLDALLSRCHPRAGQAVEAVVAGEIAVAVTDPLPGPWHAEGHTERGVILAVCGRLFEDGLADCQGRPNPRELLARFCARGAAGLQGLNGDYLIAVWEKGPKRLTIVNDRLGLRRLYYWASGQRLAFAPSLSAFGALPGFPHTIDECALADYLATGHHLDGRTWYSAVQLLLPASVLTFSNGRLTLRNYWQLGQGGSAVKQGVDNGIEQWLSFVELAIRRRLNGSEGPVKVWGDGSEPSSLLVNLLQKDGRKVETIGSSNGKSRTANVRCPCATGIVTINAAERGLPCHVAQLASLGKDLGQDRGAVFTAHPAQLISNRCRTTRDVASSQADQLISMLCRPLLLQEEIRQILRPEVYRLVQGVTADSIARAYAKAPGETIASKAQAVLLRQHQQHLTPFDLEQHAGGCRIAAPFTDSAVIENAWPVLASQREESPLRSAEDESISIPYPLIDPVEGSLGFFFRLPKLREFLSRQTEGRCALEKTCAIAGVCLSLAALANNGRTRHEAALSTGEQL
jgi:hypothetical protein